MIIKICMNLLLIILCFSSSTFLSHAAETLSPNETLSGNQTIISSGGNFELGFFTPGNSSKHYIGIWYKKLSGQTIIWVANRENPVSDKNYAQLKILDGNLVLLNESQIKIWSTDLDNIDTNNSVSAVLLDDGNLVLRQGLGSNSSFEQNLWESFKNPAHTWMPGARIGYNKKTKKKQILTAWKSSDDPAPGLYTLEADLNRSQYVIKWNMSEQYWASGAWDGEIFSLVPEMRVARRTGYNFTYVDNENESYYMYTVGDPTIISRQILDVSGQVKQSMWTGTSWTQFWYAPKQCDVYGYCGEFGVCNETSLPFCSCLLGFKPRFGDKWELDDFSGGCVRKERLECGNANRKKDRFMMSSNMGMPRYTQVLRVESRSKCEAACSSNCSCTAFAYDEGGCSLWDGEILNMQRVSEGNSSGRTIYVRLSAYSSLFKGQKNDKGVVIGATVGCSVVVVVLVVLAVMAAIWRRKRRHVGTYKTEGSLLAFRYKDLQIATKNFSDKLGGGGFGSVYRGNLPDLTVVAVKRLENINQGEKQFRAEVSTIGTIHHVNLVRLLGFCREGEKQLLVYEYMKNGSLDSYLFNGKESNSLKWKMRYQIALGIARGLEYLHDKCRDCIIHCDIKPQNILLDTEFHPKVGDFGLAKLISRDFSRVLTTMRGTRGYLAPEWLSGVAITAKADVYSYGMMMFELVSGRRNTEPLQDESVTFFPSLAASVTVNGGDIIGLLDSSLNRDADEEEVLRLCKVACWCVQDDEYMRPSMSRVVQILEGVMDVSLPPIPQSLRVLLAARQEHILFFTHSSNAASSEV